MPRGFVCYSCALEGSGSEKTALIHSDPLRERVLKGQVIQCDLCEEYKSVWLWLDPETGGYRR